MGAQPSFSLCTINYFVREYILAESRGNVKRVSWRRCWWPTDNINCLGIRNVPTAWLRYFIRHHPSSFPPEAPPQCVISGTMILLLLVGCPDDWSRGIAFNSRQWMCWKVMFRGCLVETKSFIEAVNASTDSYTFCCFILLDEPEHRFGILCPMDG